MGQFAPHGSIVVHHSGRVLVFEAAGPFNSEAVEALIRAYTPLLEDVKQGGTYAMITVFHRSMLVTPDALTAFDELLGEWRRAGLAPVASAYVAGAEVEGRAIMMPMFAKVFDGFGLFREFFDLAEAEAWVTAELAKSA